MSQAQSNASHLGTATTKSGSEEAEASTLLEEVVDNATEEVVETESPEIVQESLSRQDSSRKRTLNLLELISFDL